MQYWGGGYRYIVQDNKGPSSARNAGIMAAKGEYLYFMDADDEMMPNALYVMISNIKRHNVDMVFANHEFIDIIGKKGIADDTNCHCFSQKKDVIELIKNYANDPKSFKVLHAGWNKLFKSSIIKNNKVLWDNVMNVDEDNLFVLDYICFCESLYYLGDCYYRYYHYAQDNFQSKKVYLNPLEFSKIIDSFSNILAGLNDSEVILAGCYAEWAIWRMFQISAYTDWDEKDSIDMTRLAFSTLCSDARLQESLPYYTQKHDDNPRIIPTLIKEGDIEALVQTFKNHVLKLRN